MKRGHNLKWVGLLGLAALVLWGQNPAAADKATDAARTALTKRYADKNAATAQLDVDAYWGDTAENYVLVTDKGQRKSADQLRAETTRLFSAAESAAETSIVEKLSLKGATATVTLRGTGTIVVQVSETKRNILRVTERWTDTWVQRNGEWWLTHTKVTSALVTLNGKKMPS